jgi:hypothetical protein
MAVDSPKKNLGSLDLHLYIKQYSYTNAAQFIFQI